MSQERTFELHTVGSYKAERVIFHALPGLGKSFAVAGFANQALDSDIIQMVVIGDKGYQVSKKLGWSEDKLMQQMSEMIVRITHNAPQYKFVASNMYIEPKGFKPFLVTISPDDYIQHLEIAKRVDLLEKFDHDLLRDWASASFDRQKDYDLVHVLTPGEFLTSVADDFYSAKITKITY
jgi:hypothetical protein